MSGESGVIIYRPGQEGKRIKDWGFHCFWPPKWIILPDDFATLTKNHPSEREEVFQRGFQKKVAEALRKCGVPEPENLSIEELMEESRKHDFWICEDGTVVISQDDLWTGQSVQRWRNSI